MTKDKGNNRTFVELKLTFRFNVLDVLFGNNRTFVELKREMYADKRQKQQSNNRTFVELKHTFTSILTKRSM